MNVIVLFGGKSTEYEISCKSAFNVLENMSDHKIFKIGITKNGRWFYTTAGNEEIKTGKWQKNKNNIPVTLDMERKCFIKQGRKIPCDVVFPVLHGKNGEDGTVQGLLALLELPYVGSHVLASSVCMDKVTANILFEKAGLKHVKWLLAEKFEYIKNPAAVIEKTIKALSFPLFVKPSNAGSSVGVTKCTAVEMLKEAFDLAFKVDNRAIIEQAIHCPKEIEIAVMGNESPIAAVAGRVVSAKEVYDYKAKYQSSKSFNQIPADINVDIAEKIRSLAVKAYRACNCAGLSRVDFFLDEQNEIYINEINTLPGFTSISMFPQAFEASGLSYPELINSLLDYAVNYEKY